MAGPSSSWSAFWKAATGPTACSSPRCATSTPPAPPNGAARIHDPETHLIPNVLGAASGRLPHVEVYGNDYATSDGTAVRDYIHIADLGSAHILALDYLAAGHSSDYFNLGTGRGNSVLEVIEAARRVTGKPIHVEYRARRAGDPSHLVAGAGKAREVLGWKPAFESIDEIVGTAWQWQSNHPNGYRAA